MKSITTVLIIGYSCTTSIILLTYFSVFSPLQAIFSHLPSKGVIPESHNWNSFFSYGIHTSKKATYWYARKHTVVKNKWNFLLMPLVKRSIVQQLLHLKWQHQYFNFKWTTCTFYRRIFCIIMHVVYFTFKRQNFLIIRFALHIWQRLQSIGAKLSFMAFEGYKNNKWIYM